MDKKELIKNAAIRVIAREGYHSSRIEAIAEEAGISVGSIYNYFKNKQEMFEYIFYVIYKEKNQYLSELEESNAPALEKIASFMDFQNELWEKNPDVFRISLQDGIPYCKEGVNTKKMYDEMLGRVANIIKEGQKAGEIKEVDPYMIALTIYKSPKIIRYDFNAHNKAYEERKKQFISFIIDGIKK